MKELVPLNTALPHEWADLREALTRYTGANEAINTHVIVRAALRTHAGLAIAAALDTIPALCLEARHLRALLHLAALGHADLVAAARATITADHDGEPDPLWYLRDELAARGQLPTGPLRHLQPQPRPWAKHRGQPAGSLQNPGAQTVRCRAPGR